MKKILVLLVVVFSFVGCSTATLLLQAIKEDVHDEKYHEGEKCPYDYIDCPYWTD